PDQAHRPGPWLPGYVERPQALPVAVASPSAGAQSYALWPQTAPGSEAGPGGRVRHWAPSAPACGPLPRGGGRTGGPGYSAGSGHDEAARMGKSGYRAGPEGGSSVVSAAPG